jgi:hypothetical protein
MSDFIIGNQGYGGVAGTLLAHNMDVGALRPFTIDGDPRTFITVNEGGKKVTRPVANATGLPYRSWILLDKTIQRIVKERLRLVGDLNAAGLTYNVTNGLGTPVIQFQNMGDISPATISMDGLRQSERDRPTFDLTTIPLPIIHKDLSFSLREVAVSRQAGTPLDTTTAELAARRVAEEVEKLALGISSSYTYGGGTVYGITNFPSRMTKVLSDPTGGTWTPATLVSEILAMRAQAQAEFHYGPFMVYTSPGWDAYLDDDYSAAKGDNTLRERIGRIEGIRGIRTLDYLTGMQILLVEMNSDVIRMINGMAVTPVQWETHGGMQLNFKIMTIQVPHLRADQNGNTGIVHGSVP